MPRIPAHKIEEKAINLIRSNVALFDALYREVSHRDYGIDAVIELFDHDEITGRLILLQVKGSESRYTIGTRSGVVSCQVSQGTLKYLNQNNIPVVLVAVDIANQCFFYTCLADTEVVNRNVNQPTVHLIAENVCQREESTFTEWLKELAEDYYGRRQQ